jgi:hypothetical protein
LSALISCGTFPPKNTKALITPPPPRGLPPPTLCVWVPYWECSGSTKRTVCFQLKTGRCGHVCPVLVAAWSKQQRGPGPARRKALTYGLGRGGTLAAITMDEMVLAPRDRFGKAGLLGVNADNQANGVGGPFGGPVTGGTMTLLATVYTEWPLIVDHPFETD